MNNRLCSIEQGARATLRLIADHGLAEVTGRYFDGLEEARAHPQAYDLGARRRLRGLSAQLGGLPAETVPDTSSGATAIRRPQETRP